MYQQKVLMTAAHIAAFAILAVGQAVAAGKKPIKNKTTQPSMTSRQIALLKWHEGAHDTRFDVVTSHSVAFGGAHV